MIDMQEEDIRASEKIESTTAVFRNFSPERPVSNAVVYYCESNTNEHDTKEQHQATIELTYKVFDVHTCEKYEVRTGYLSRYNYLSKSINESSQEEIKDAIIKSKHTQNVWISKIKPELPEFKIQDWRECIFEEDNIYFEVCKKLIVDKIQENKEFADSFSKTVSDYLDRHRANEINIKEYVFEELSWILSLPLLHLNKPIYLIHVGAMSDAIRGLFTHFPNLQKAVRWLIPKFHTMVFKNKYDFLMDYRNNARVGYSYATENKEIVKSITTFKKENDLTKEELTLALSREANEKNLLYSIIEKLPGHVYWLNRDNVYLGCNNLQAEDFCLKSRDEVIGKTNKQLYPLKDADIIEKNNIRVMETGISYEGEEVSIDGISYLSHKTPLYDTNGKVIGLLGISIDITDRKKAEQLEIDNKLQQIKIDAQEDFQEFVNKMSHDMRMPLKELENFKNECSYLKTEDYEKLRKINMKIQEIAGDILCQKKKDRRVNFDSKERDILIPLALEEVVLKQNRQHKETNIEFKYSFNPLNTRDQFVFIRGNHVYFDRMMSNLTNNAAEALDGKSGVVEITLNADDKIVKIGINDNGKGMPQEIVEKILNNVSVGTTKATGHGLGLEQVKDAIKLFNGKMEIESKEGKGTRITLTFPRSELPSWIADRITLRKGSTVVILDDDESMHDLWRNLLKDYSNDLTLKFFTKGDDARKFIRFSFEKDNMFLISDYDIREENTGLVVIKESEMQTQSIIVTSIHDDWKVLDALERTKMRMIPKQFLFSKNVEVFVE